MNLESAKAQIAAATAAAEQQIELNRKAIGNQLDTADRVIMQQAALAAIALAKRPEPVDPPA